MNAHQLILAQAAALSLYPINAQSCDGSGSSATYTETIEDNTSVNGGKVRHIMASGCPNHINYKVGQNPNEAVVQSKDINLPAYPCFSGSSHDVKCLGGAVGITLNGGISIFSKFAGGTCDASNDAVQMEGDTFDSCGGHSAPTNGGEYHYHVAPSCLLDQLGDGPNAGHSPQIGWAYDGFPIYGPRGADGDLIYPCTHNNMDAANCLDECGGHDQHEIDGFKYHYHVTGPVGDLISSPVDPLPSSDMSPYTIGCLKGVPFDWSVSKSADPLPQTCSTDGVCSQYTPIANAGITQVYGADLMVDATSEPTKSPTANPAGPPSPGTSFAEELSTASMRGLLRAVLVAILGAAVAIV